MILISTLRKMGDKPVFIVNVPAHTIRLEGVAPIDITSYSNAFATKGQADKFAEQFDPHKFGATESPAITRKSAREVASILGWTFSKE